MSETETTTTAVLTTPRLKQRYQDEIKTSLREQFGYGNVKIGRAHV